MSEATNQGYLPAGKYIINHDIMNCTAEGVTGNHLYSGRALGLSEPWDIIQMHPELKSQWRDIHDHYQRIGLSHSENVIWDLNLKELGSHIGYKPSVFYYGPQECHYWGDYFWLDVVEYINSKNNFMQLADKLGVDTPETHCYRDVEEISSDDIANITFPCYLKAAISVAGVGIYRCENAQQLKAAMKQFDCFTPVQIQEEINTNTFLNLQYRVMNNEVVKLAASEQILDGFAHQGNRVPAIHEPWAVVDPMANWLKDKGIQGIFAFDLAVEHTDEGTRFPVIECNPRYNGASYPTIIAEKLDIPEWSAVTLKTGHSKLSDIDLHGIEFDNTTGEGVIIVNWGIIHCGKLVVLLAGEKPVQETLLEKLKCRL